MDKPLFLITFANDKPGRLLRGVAEEQDAIKDALDPRKEDCELKFVSSIDTKELIDRLSEKTPAVFHYGGHAEGDILFFNSKERETLNAEEFSSLLSHFEGVELVFLNGCSTFDFSEYLLNAGVRHVITTHEKIGDEAAVEFARYFYRQLREGETVPDAYEMAKDAVKLRFGGEDPRGFSIPAYWKDTPPADMPFPWHLANSSREEKPGFWKWEEPEEEAFGTVVSLKKGGAGLEGVDIRKGAQIKTRSDREGNFELKLKYSWVGKKINIEAKKPRFEVVNREALTIFPEKNRDPDEKLAEIVMCPEGKRDIYASEYYSIAIQVGIAREEHSLKDRNNIIGHVSTIADQLKGLDVSDSLDQTVKAFHFLSRGQINAAIEVLKEEDLDAELEAVKTNEKELQTKKKYLLEALLLKASTLVLGGRFDAAETFYQKAVELAPGDYSILDKYLDFLFKQNQFQKGKALCQANLKGMEDGDAGSLLIKSNFLHQQGRFFWKSNDYKIAKDCFKESLAIRNRLVEENEQPAPGFYLGLVAATQNNLGVLYMEEHNFEKAKTHLLDSLKIDSGLAENDPGAYIPYKATNLCDLGMMHTYQKDFESAEKSYDAALKIYRELAEENPYKYEPKLAKTLLYKGNVLTDQKKFEEALPVMQESLLIYGKYEKINPEAYRPVLSETYHKLGKLFRKADNFEQARENYERSLEIREALWLEAPEVYADEYAATLNNLGRFFQESGEPEKAERCFKASLEIDEALMQSNEKVYVVYQLYNLKDLGFFYASVGRKAEARAYFQKAIEVFNRLPEPRKANLQFGLDLLRKKLEELS